MAGQPRRRRVLAACGALLASLAGCSGSDDDAPDADGDGVADGQDYAPRNPSVQSRSDVAAAATATDRTPSGGVRATAGPAPSGTENSLSVPSAAFDGRTHATSYSSSRVNAVVAGHPTIPGETAKLVAISYTYPRGEAVTYGVSDPFDVPADGERTRVGVPITEGEVRRDTRLHYLLFAMPPDLSFEDASAGDLTFLFETDPFRISGSEISRDPPPYARPTEESASFSRTNREGMYALRFSGSTDGRSWNIRFIVWKSAYAEARERPRGRGYDEYVALARNGGIAGELASLLAADATANGFTDQRMTVEMVIDFVQGLPYVPDDVSTGFDQYTQTVQETIVEAGGDCEDTSILLAAVLQAEPFGYDTVLIAPPEHMAVGVYGNDLPGAYWEYDGRTYYYVETTGEGWGVGDLPDTYRGQRATVYQV